MQQLPPNIEKLINYKFTYINYKFNMKNGKDNEMRFVLSILKSPEMQYSATSLARNMNISSMGALKIARKLEKEAILSSKQIGKAKVFHLNLNNDYARQYVKFLLKREAEIASPYVKRWIRELEKLHDAQLVILFGSVLRKGQEAIDIDALVVIGKKSFDKVKKELELINRINDKKIHPVYQTKGDLKRNIAKPDKVVLNAIKGIVVSGNDTLIEILS